MVRSPETRAIGVLRPAKNVRGVRQPFHNYPVGFTVTRHLRNHASIA